MYTVKEVAEISKVTVKTLHHYHKIGLLLPGEIMESGYRLYGAAELERLQQILFYKELDFTLEAIKKLLDGQPDRLTVLRDQKEKLVTRLGRLEEVVRTLDKSITSTERGVTMNHSDMFHGFSQEEEWREALSEQNQHLNEKYGYDMLGESSTINVEELNEQASEAASFMNGMAQNLRHKVKHNDNSVFELIRAHLEYLNQGSHQLSPADFAAQNKFFLQDDFHLNMLESQQTGLAYYLGAAAEAYAEEQSVSE